MPEEYGDRRPGLRPLSTRSLGEGLALAREVREGFPVEAVDELIDSELIRQEDLFRLVIPRRTLSHRKSKGEPLTPEESNRLARVAGVVVAALELFGGTEPARRWLHRPNRALEGRTPLDLLDSDAGARVVEQVLGRIEHGVHT